MNKLYLVLGLLAVIALGWWRYDYVVAQWNAEKTRADNAVTKLATRDKEITAERKNLVEANEREKQRQSEKEVLQSEYDKKLKCINDGNCIVRMRYGSASCPTASLHSTEPGASGSNDIQAQDQRNLSEWAARVELSADLDARAIEGFKKELEIKSRPDYCKVK